MFCRCTAHPLPACQAAHIYTCAVIDQAAGGRRRVTCWGHMHEFACKQVLHAAPPMQRNPLDAMLTRACVHACWVDTGCFITGGGEERPRLDSVRSLATPHRCTKLEA
jgi:hypothetical protein